MKPGRLLLLLTAAALAGLAQTPDREVPIDNARVKVVVVHRAMPGVETRPHEHDVNRVMIYLNAGGQIIRHQNGKVENLTWKAGEALWSPRGGVHTAEITGSQPARIVEVELKGAVPAQPPALSKLDPVSADARHYSLELDKPQARVVRVRLAAGEKTPVLEHGSNRLVTYLTAQELEVTRAAGQRSRETHAAGQVEWLDPGSESIRNAGKGVAEAVIIYLK